MKSAQPTNDTVKTAAKEIKTQTINMPEVVYNEMVKEGIIVSNKAQLSTSMLAVMFVLVKLDKASAILPQKLKDFLQLKQVVNILGDRIQKETFPKWFSRLYELKRDGRIELEKYPGYNRVNALIMTFVKTYGLSLPAVFDGGRYTHPVLECYNTSNKSAAPTFARHRLQFNVSKEVVGDDGVAKTKISQEYGSGIWKPEDMKGSKLSKPYTAVYPKGEKAIFTTSENKQVLKLHDNLSTLLALLSDYFNAGESKTLNVFNSLNYSTIEPFQVKPVGGFVQKGKKTVEGTSVPKTGLGDLEF